MKMITVFVVCLLLLWVEGTCPHMQCVEQGLLKKKIPVIGPLTDWVEMTTPLHALFSTISPVSCPLLATPDARIIVGVLVVVVAAGALIARRCTRMHVVVRRAKGEKFGMGLTYHTDPVVYRVDPGTPAARAGVLNGWRVAAVGG
eukprot:gene30787-23647_t